MTAEARVVVLDSSVGVKWIKPEAGRERARMLLEAHRSGEVRIVVAAHFVTELIGVAVRRGGPELGERVWKALRLADLTTIALDDAVATEALRQCATLQCSFYDALPAAIAALTGATLVSADARAHERFAHVELV